MLIELAPGSREVLRPLYGRLPGLHGCIDAALNGGMGIACADDPLQPAVAHIHLEFHLLAGDPDHPAAEGAVRTLSPSATLVPADPSWERLLRRVWGKALHTRARVAFRAGAWDRPRLRAFAEMLPDGSY